jgi:uncharacterized membrane protein
MMLVCFVFFGFALGESFFAMGGFYGWYGCSKSNWQMILDIAVLLCCCCYKVANADPQSFQS